MRDSGRCAFADATELTELPLLLSLYPALATSGPKKGPSRHLKAIRTFYEMASEKLMQGPRPILEQFQPAIADQSFRDYYSATAVDLTENGLSSRY